MKYFICLVCIYFFIVGCQSTTRFVSQNTTEKNSNNSSNTNKQTPVISTDTNHYNISAKTIYPKNLSKKYNIVAIAEKWLGTPYLYGGNTKAGIDCSGFVKNVYHEIGINLPRTSAQQFEYLKPTNVPVIGDLVFFKKGNLINHVGIFIGEGKMIHSSSGKGVIIQTILGSSLENRFAGYRKVF